MKQAVEVFESHLELRLNKDAEADIQQNFADDIVILSNDGTFYGHDGVRESASLLQSRLPDAEYAYLTKLVHENIAFLEWSAKSSDKKVCNGADSFLIKNGKIQVQTIYYRVDEG